MKLAPVAALLISVVVAVPAFASGDDTATVNGPKTRAEVKAELAQARADGELSMNPNDPAYPAQFATGGYTVPRVQINTVRTSAERDASLRNQTRAATPLLKPAKTIWTLPPLVRGERLVPRRRTLKPCGIQNQHAEPGLVRDPMPAVVVTAGIRFCTAP